MFCFKKTKSILTPLQSDLNITNLLTLLSTLIWSILQLSLSSYILAIDCPIFSPTIQAISTLSDIFGGLIMFSLHYSIAMHIILLPAYVHRPLKRLLILSPSIIIVLLTVTFRLLDNVFFYSSNSQFSNTKLRLKACSDIINGTFVCQLSPRSTFTFRDAEGICQLVSLAVIVGYAVAAKNVLGGYGYYEYLELNVSLRLYIWQTIVLYVVWLVMWIWEIIGKEGYSSPCADRMTNEVSSPEGLVLISCWIIIRAFLFTPIPKEWRSRGKYKMRQGELQRFVWGRGGGAPTATTKTGKRRGKLNWKIEKEKFWADVMGVDTLVHSRSAVKSFIKRGMSVKSPRNAWQDLLLEGDLASFEVIDDNVLLREVGYGPEPRVLGNQPVFDLEVCAACMWMSKIVYADGVWSGAKIERESEEGSVSSATSSNLSSTIDDIEIVEMGLAPPTVEDQKAAEAFESACDVTMSTFGFDSKIVFETKTHAVRAVIFWNVSTRCLAVSFRGSKMGANFMSDAKFFRKRHPTMPTHGVTALGRYFNQPYVHRGFLGAFVDSGIEAKVVEQVKSLVSTMRGVDGSGDVSVIVTGHSLGGALAQLCAYSLTTVCSLIPDEITCYTFGCPGLGNLNFCWTFESVCPSTFNVVNNTDWVYYVGKYASRVFHPGIPVHIGRSGDLVCRPTFLEMSLSHFWWRERISDHLFPSYHRSLMRVIAKNLGGGAEDVRPWLELCPTLGDFVCGAKAEVPEGWQLKWNQDLTKRESNAELGGAEDQEE